MSDKYKDWLTNLATATVYDMIEMMVDRFGVESIHDARFLSQIVPFIEVYFNTCACEMETDVFIAKTYGDACKLATECGLVQHPHDALQITAFAVLHAVRNMNIKDVVNGPKLPTKAIYAHLQSVIRPFISEMPINNCTETHENENMFDFTIKYIETEDGPVELTRM